MRVTQDELSRIAAEWLLAARAAWPTIQLDEQRFVAEVTARLPSEAGLDAARAVHAADLWLTIACAAGDPLAIASFDHHYLGSIAGALVQTGLRPDQIDEVKQELRKKLLVGDGDGPRIAAFSGRADLRTWVRTAAVRAGIDLLRRQREVPLEDEEALAALPAVADDPELAYFKVHYRSELRAAITDAIAQLAPRDRLLLKYHYVDRLGVERLGVAFAVHHATAARWLIAAREALAVRAQRLLVERLGVTRSELRSIARLVESQLDLSVRRLLG